MKKKLLIALTASAAGLVLLVFLLFVKGGDMLTLPQRIEVDRYLSVNPFFDEETGEETSFVQVATANNSESTQKNTFLWFLNRYESEASYVELDIAFDADKRPCLGDSYEDVEESPVLLERVLNYINEKEDKETGLVINLREYTNLESLSACLSQSGMQRRTVITGVNEKSVDSVKSFFPNICVLCDYDSDTKSSLEELKEAGADGIICPSDKVSASLMKKSKELDLHVWVRCENEVYGTIKAMNYCVDGVISTVPEVACMIRNSWGENIIDDVRSAKNYYDLK